MEKRRSRDLRFVVPIRAEYRRPVAVDLFPQTQWMDSVRDEAFILEASRNFQTIIYP